MMYISHNSVAPVGYLYALGRRIMMNLRTQMHMMRYVITDISCAYLVFLSMRKHMI